MLTQVFRRLSPAPAPTHGTYQQLWQTALYPASQAAALAPSAEPWPEVWGCGVPTVLSVAACSMNGVCGHDGGCDCQPEWRGPACAALVLRPTRRDSGMPAAKMASLPQSAARPSGTPPECSVHFDEPWFELGRLITARR